LWVVNVEAITLEAMDVAGVGRDGIVRGERKRRDVVWCEVEREGLVSGGAMK
jgi:hypothetical protein